MTLDSWLHYQIWGTPPPKKKRKAPRHFRRGPARNWRYKRWIRTLPSCVSGVDGCEAAHTGTDGGKGQKSSDYSCVPLTTLEHLEYHQIGKQDFEKRHRVSFVEVVSRLNSTWFQFSGMVK